jgi:hypothetical protein
MLNSAWIADTVQPAVVVAGSMPGGACNVFGASVAWKLAFYVAQGHNAGQNWTFGTPPDSFGVRQRTRLYGPDNSCQVTFEGNSVYAGTYGLGPSPQQGGTGVQGVFLDGLKWGLSFSTGGGHYDIDDVVGTVPGVDGAFMLRCRNTSFTFGRRAANTATGATCDVSIGNVWASYAELSRCGLIDNSENRIYCWYNTLNAFQVISRNVRRVQNTSGVTIDANSVVRLTGTDTITAAQANTSANASSVFGVTLTSVINNQYTYVATGLTVAKFDGAITPGVAYLSPGSLGLATTTVPASSGTNQKLVLGKVTRDLGSNYGVIDFRADPFPIISDGVADGISITEEAFYQKRASTLIGSRLATWFWDDFIGNKSPNWTESGTGGTLTQLEQACGVFDVTIPRPGAANSQRGYLLGKTTTLEGSVIPPTAGAKWYMACRVKFPYQGASAYATIGLQDAGPTRMYFGPNSTASHSNLIWWSDAGTESGTTDTGVAWDTNTHLVEIYRDGSTSRVLLDGVLIATKDKHPSTAATPQFNTDIYALSPVLFTGIQVDWFCCAVGVGNRMA